MAQKRTYSSIVSSSNHHDLSMVNKKAEKKTSLEKSTSHQICKIKTSQFFNKQQYSPTLNNPSIDQHTKKPPTMAETLRGVNLGKFKKEHKSDMKTTEKCVTMNGIRVNITSKRTKHLAKNFEDYEKKRNESLGCYQLTKLLNNQSIGNIYYDLKVVEFTPENQVMVSFGYTCKHRISHCIYEARFKKAFIAWPFCSKQSSSTFMTYTIPVSKREVPLLNHGSYLDVRDLDSICPNDITVRNLFYSMGEENTEGAHIKLKDPSKVMELLKSHFRPSNSKDWRIRATEEGFAFGTIYKMEEIKNPKWKTSNFLDIIDGMKIVSNDEYNYISQCITTIGMKDGQEVPLLFKVDKKHISRVSLRKGSTTISDGLRNCLSIISRSFGGPVY